MVNNAQDINELVDVLPRSLSDASILIVKQQYDDDAYSSRDFTVNQTSLYLWLHFLKSHNPGYRDITIQVSEDYSNPIFNLLRLEDDSDAGQDNGHDTGSDDGYGADTGPMDEYVDDEVDNIVTTGVSSSSHNVINESTAIVQTINWPTPSANPIDEYDRPYLLTRSFPCLFTYGRGDVFTKSSRRIEVSLHAALQHYQACRMIK